MSIPTYVVEHGSPGSNRNRSMNCALGARVRHHWSVSTLSSYITPHRSVSKRSSFIKHRIIKGVRAMVHSADGDTNSFDFIFGVLQGDTLVLCMFMLCLDSVLQTSIDLIKENGFILKKKKKARSRNYNRCRLRRWPSASCKYTSPSQTLPA